MSCLLCGQSNAVLRRWGWAVVVAVSIPLWLVLGTLLAAAGLLRSVGVWGRKKWLVTDETKSTKHSPKS